MKSTVYFLVHNSLHKMGLITTFACVTLPECCAEFCVGVQHSSPNLLLIFAPDKALHTFTPGNDCYAIASFRVGK